MHARTFQSKKPALLFQHWSSLVSVIRSPSVKPLLHCSPLFPTKSIPYWHSGIPCFALSSLLHSVGISTQNPHPNATASAFMSTSSTIEHFVLFKIRPSADPSKVDTWLSSLRALSSLPSVSYLSAGPVLRLRSAAASELAFTHLLHCRYESKEKLSEYAIHPAHVKVVKELGQPICDDVMAVDWIGQGLVPGPLAPGSAISLTLVKLKEGSDASELTSALASAKDSAEGATLVSYGENFSSGRAKGYSFGMLATFPGVDDLDKLEGAQLEPIKEKVQPIIESVIVLDFVVSEPPPPSAANL